MSPFAGARLLRRTDAKAMTARTVERESSIFECFENTDIRVLFSGGIDPSCGLFLSSAKESLLAGMHLRLSVSMDTYIIVIAIVINNMII